MNRNKLYLAALGMMIASAAGCELLVDFDRTKIDGGSLDGTAGDVVNEVSTNDVVNDTKNDVTQTDASDAGDASDGTTSDVTDSSTADVDDGSADADDGSDAADE
jgi:hypothetical protein